MSCWPATDPSCNWSWRRFLSRRQANRVILVIARNSCADVRDEKVQDMRNRCFDVRRRTLGSIGRPADLRFVFVECHRPDDARGTRRYESLEGAAQTRFSRYVTSLCGLI
jgi:hypothetical protein